MFLNWALPVGVLPPLTQPLRYDSLRWEGEDWVFLSAALFHQQILEIPGVRFPKVSYPQLSLRLCTLDGDGMPSFYLCTLLIPAWVLPSVRLVARQRAYKAAFTYPQKGAPLSGDPLIWRVKQRRQRLEVSVTNGAGTPGPGPTLGSWEQGVAYFQRRNRWYFGASEGLRRLEVKSRDAQALPVTARVDQATLLSSCVEGDSPTWPALHSAWLSPEIPFVFELGWAGDSSLPRRVPAPG